MSKSKAIQISIAGKIFSASIPAHIYEQIKAEADHHLYENVKKFIVEICMDWSKSLDRKELRKFLEMWPSDMGCAAFIDIIVAAWNEYNESKSARTVKRIIDSIAVKTNFDIYGTSFTAYLPRELSEQLKAASKKESFLSVRAFIRRILLSYTSCDDAGLLVYVAQVLARRECSKSQAISILINEAFKKYQEDNK